MDKSKQSTDVLNLGKELVRLFSEHGRTDLTTAWMAQYLAELMKKVKAEKKPAKKKELEKDCVGIILDLWNKRNRFPEGVRPLSGLSHATAVIGALQNSTSDRSYWAKYQNPDTGSAWGDYIQALRQALEDTLKICIAASVTEKILRASKKWRKHDALLDENEKLLIDYLDETLNNIESRVTTIFIGKDESKKTAMRAGSKKSVDRIAIVIERLQETLNKQSKALDNLEKRVLNRKPISLSMNKKKKTTS